MKVFGHPGGKQVVGISTCFILFLFKTYIPFLLILLASEFAHRKPAASSLFAGLC